MKQILLILTIIFIYVVALYGQVGIELEFTLLECGTAYEVSGKGLWDYEVFIPETHEGLPVTRIADFGFYYNRMTRTCLPNSILSIGKYAFGRSFLEYAAEYSLISIPLSVEYIGRSAFRGNRGFVIFVEAESQPAGWHKKWNSNNVPVQWGHDGSFFFFTLIDDGTAYEISKGYTPFSHIVIPSSHLGLPVTKIGDFVTPVWMPGMFRFNLKSIYIPDSVKIIGNSAFSRAGLTEIVLPESITHIGNGAFWVVNRCLK